MPDPSPSMLRIPPSLRAGTLADANAIANLHAQSWRNTYRGLFTDAFLDGPVYAEREALWTRRLGGWDPTRNVVLLAENAGELVGFASVLLDAEPAWGARLDNLHVHPACKGSGAGRALLNGAGRWVLDSGAGDQLHLMVFEGNTAARAFYDAMQGDCVERRAVTVEDGSRLYELRYVWRNLGAPGALAGPPD